MSRRDPSSVPFPALKPLRIPPAPLANPASPLPDWVRLRAAANKTFRETARTLRERGLRTVCEDESCPNIGECFGKGAAAFMILGEDDSGLPCCAAVHGRPPPPDLDRLAAFAETVARLEMKHVVIAIAERDDLLDGGASHIAGCIRRVRMRSPLTRIEAWVPGFRGCLPAALDAFHDAPPDVLNHTLDTVPRLFAEFKPGADYVQSLALLKLFKQRHPSVLTKSGLRLGRGETDDEVLDVLRDLRCHDVDMLTLAQYLPLRRGDLPVERYLWPDEFRAYGLMAEAMGFLGSACGPLVRATYHAGSQHVLPGIHDLGE